MGKRSRDLAAPDLTPLIDVVFLLLIFFLVSTVFKKDELAFLLNLPKAQFGESSKKVETKDILIELKESEVAINGKKVSFEELINELPEKSEKKSPLVVLRVDKAVKYESIIRVIDTLKKKSLNNISLITEKVK